MISAHHVLEQGTPDKEILRKAKETASFSGPKRDLLVALLNSLELGDAFGLKNYAELFGDTRHLVRYI